MVQKFSYYGGGEVLPIQKVTAVHLMVKLVLGARLKDNDATTILV